MAFIQWILYCELAKLTIKPANFAQSARKSFLLYEKLVFCYQNCSGLLCKKEYSSDREKLLKIGAECEEFAKFWRSLEQVIPEVSWVGLLLEGMEGFSSPFESFRTIPQWSKLLHRPTFN